MHELATAAGYGIADMVCCNLLGEIWEARGVFDTSRAFWERALQHRRQLDAPRMRTAAARLGQDKAGHVHGSMPTALLAVARVAAKQGDLTAASRLLREGLPVAEEMREIPTAQQMAELLRKTSEVEPTQHATLRPEGGVWHVDFNGTNVHVPDLKGLWHLRELVSRPREFIPALALVGAPSEEPFQAATPALCSIAKRSGSIDGVSPSWTTSWMTPRSTATPRGWMSAAPSATR
jgi:hypothetical protein